MSEHARKPAELWQEAQRKKREKEMEHRRGGYAPAGAHTKRGQPGRLNPTYRFSRRKSVVAAEMPQLGLIIRPLVKGG